MRPKSALRAAQNRSVTRLYEMNGQQAVVPMGGGKTASAMTAIRELIDANEITCALVMAPKRVCQLVWMREHLEWEHLAGLKIQHVAGTPAQRKKKLLEPGFDIYVVGKDNTQWLCEVLESLPPWHPLYDVLCIDELSAFKSARGKRFKELKKLVARFRTVWGLTGTPRPNGYDDQYPLLKLVSRGAIWSEDRTFDKWRMQRFMPDNPFRLDIAKWTIRPEWEERTKRDISRWSFTVAQEDLPELPPIQPVYHWIDLPPKVMTMYKEMERHLLTEVDGQSVLAQTQAVSSGKLAQIVQGFMYDESGEVLHIHNEKEGMLTELLEGLNDQHALIEYEFREDLARLQKMLPDFRWFGGGCTDKQAIANERDWNAGDLQYLGMHPASAGHGLNLQFGGSQLIVYGMTWSAELFDQLLKRFHRPGQKFDCFVHYIFARNSVDEIKYDRVHNKISEQEAFRNYLERI